MQKDIFRGNVESAQQRGIHLCGRNHLQRRQVRHMADLAGLAGAIGVAV
jgi:hypothetical protein